MIVDVLVFVSAILANLRVRKPLVATIAAELDHAGSRHCYHGQDYCGLQEIIQLEISREYQCSVLPVFFITGLFPVCMCQKWIQSFIRDIHFIITFLIVI